MTRPARLLRLAAAGLLALSLGACVTVLPKTKPAQLYRFGVSPAAAPAATPAAATPQVGVLRLGGAFQRESARDQILTIHGEQVAYIAEARWVAPAEVLFEQALISAFEADSGRVRLISRGEPARNPYGLRVDVRNFETRYENGDSPVVLVRVRAVLIPAKPGADPLEQMFEARAPASTNRVSAIVAAYDRALTQVLGQVVAWTDASVS